MCKKCSVYFVLFFIPVFLFSQNKYSISVDLNHVKNDKVKVVILTPQITSEEIIYVMPDVIPGSYSQKNYGRFISSFKAYSTKGKKLSVTHSEKQQSKVEYLLSRLLPDLRFEKTSNEAMGKPPNGSQKAC